MSKVKSLLAADLGYVWPEWLPDGATWTRDAASHETLWHTPAVEPGLARWVARNPNEAIVPNDRKWLGLTPPDFGDRPWTECILIKGQEPPEMPPCPDGDGWVEWSGGECPVSGMVEVQLDNGDCETELSRVFEWQHLADAGEGCNIIRYRVHQPKYRPYTDNELKQLVRDGQYLERKDGMCGAIAISWLRASSGGPLAVRLGQGGLWIAESLLEEFVRRDGSPCGVEVSDD